VVVRKCARVPEVFSDICLASRTLEKCQAIQVDLERPIEVARVDADRSDEVAALIRGFRADLVVNVALPYQDLSIMDACLATGVSYLDTANYEPPDVAKFEYSWQWAYHDRFRERGIMATLGCGFDPGVTNVYCAYAQQQLFDEIHEVDILDCNAGEHGHAFATNFNPEINLREVTAPGRYWEQGAWKDTPPLSVAMDFEFPEVGPRKAYLMYHEELESLVRHISGLRRIRFWMTFSDNYLTHLHVLENIGMTRIDPVKFEGHEIIPLKFLRALLPDPASLAPGYRGKTCIGCLFSGTKNGEFRRVFMYNVCDHEVAYRDTKSQAISYTTGVPAMVGAMMMATNVWRGAGVFNVEQLPPAPFLEQVAKHGLPWQVQDR